MVEHQLILFGPPGTSKSHRARTTKAEALGVDDAQIVPVAFHPDYSYGEFVARLMPRTRENQIEYRVHAGPFLRALALAYIHLPQASNGQAPQNVLLLVDEINRGNCAEIFGDVFQLLDRDDEGWSSYAISVSDLVIDALEAELALLGHNSPFPDLNKRLADTLKQRQLCLPPNLIMIGTMNTSDESVYFMDSAFKRRWHFEFCAEEFSNDVPASQKKALMPSAHHLTWETFVTALNQFIRDRCTAPRLDDKLVGPWFIKGRREPDRTLADVYPKELNKLIAATGMIGDPASGVRQSRAFDDDLKTLADKMSEANRKRLLKEGGHDPKAELKFTRIRSSSGHANQYYCSKTSPKKFKSDTKGLIIEDYLEQLATFKLHSEVHRIERADIVGKLFLYLWDNVFDRDRSPLCTLLAIEQRELRTFGQFATRVDEFIKCLCPPPDIHELLSAAFVEAALDLEDDALPASDEA